MTSTTASEIMHAAIRIEVRGERFYREAADISKESQIKELFIRLAFEESEHKKIFEGLLSHVGSFEPPDCYPGEYLEYFYNYVDNKAFFTKDNKASLSETFDVLKALDFAIETEMDSILFYQELKAFVPVADDETIDAIIAEERKHFTQLSEVKKKLK